MSGPERVQGDSPDEDGEDNDLSDHDGIVVDVSCRCPRAHRRSLPTTSPETGTSTMTATTDPTTTSTEEGTVGSGYWSVLTDQVHSSGQATASCGTDWQAWSNDVRTFIGDAASSVHDGAINDALGAIAGDINQAAGRLVTDVVADGENVAGAACDTNAGDQNAAGSMVPAILINEAVSTLTLGLPF